MSHIFAYMHTNILVLESIKGYGQLHAWAGKLAQIFKIWCKGALPCKLRNWPPVNGRANRYSMQNLPNKSTIASEWGNRNTSILSLVDREFKSIAGIRHIYRQFLYLLHWKGIISYWIWIVCIITPLLSCSESRLMNWFYRICVNVCGTNNFNSMTCCMDRTYWSCSTLPSLSYNDWQDGEHDGRR